MIAVNRSASLSSFFLALLFLSWSLVAPGSARAQTSTLITPANGAVTYSNGVNFTWNSVSGALTYYLYVGTSVGAKDVVNSGETTATSLKISPMPLGTLYARLWTKSAGGWTYSDSSFTVVSPPLATLLTPANNATAYSNSVSFSWTAVSGALTYYLYVGTTVGAMDVINSGETSATSLSRANLPVRTLYVRLWTKSAAGWVYTDSTFTVIAPPQATLLTPAQGASVYSNAVGFSWSPVSGALAYYLYVGTTIGAKDVINSGETSATSLSRANLPAGTLYIRLWTKSTAAGWAYTDSSFTVVAAPQATLLTPANGAAIGTSSANFSWTSVTGAIVYYLYVGTTAGAKDVVNSGETTATSLPVASLPLGTLYVRLWTESAAGWVYADTSFTVQSEATPTVTPRNAALTLTQKQQFSATISGGGLVNWAVDGNIGGNTGVGTISASGLYTPPAVAGVHTVTGINAADSSSSASATVAVTDLTGVFTYHNDLARTGQNLSEYALTPTTVSSGQFGKRWSCPLDGAAYAQPLYVANLSIGGGTHNVLIVATEHDSVYAFDADNPGCTTYWQVSFLGSGVTTMPGSDVQCGSPQGGTSEWGITGTPVIDPVGHTLYVVAKTKESGGYFQRLHKLTLTTGQEASGSPVTIAASVPKNGSGTSTFTAQWHNQRLALALTSGGVYVGWSAHCDNGNWNGWLMRYDGTSLAQTAVFNVTPNGSAGGIWMSGGAPAVDSSGSLYLSTGNGTFDDVTSNVPPLATGDDFSMSFLKLDPTALVVQDFYTPSQEAGWSNSDLDISSGGVTVLPDGAGPSTHPNLLVGSDKQGHFWVLDRAQMQRYSSTSDNVVQYLTLPNIGGCVPDQCVNSTWAFWNGTIYTGVGAGPLMAFTLTSGLIPATAQSVASPAFKSLETNGDSSSTPVISASPTGDALVWILDNSANGDGGPAVLRAYDATKLGSALYSSALLPADAGGNSVHFALPVVANGHIYVAGAQQLTVYGLSP